MKGFQRLRNALCNKDSILILLTLLSVICSILIGLLLKYYVNVSNRQIDFISFPGEIFMNILKMLIIPLIVSSLITGIADLDTTSGGKMGLCVIIYYTITTSLALITGVVLVILIHPGNPKIRNNKISLGLENKANVNTLDAFLDILRNIIPGNFLEANFKQASTEYRTLSLPFTINNTVVIRNVTTMNIVKRNSTNVLGLVMISVVFGFILGQMGSQGRVMVEFFYVLNEVVMRLIGIVMWYSPIGIFSLIVSRIMEIENLGETASSLGLFLLTVILGLVIHAGCSLNLIFYICTRKNPLTFFRGMFRAWATALGTDSSSATLPITFKCLEENNGVDKRVTRFVLPIGATINMDGTALYEAVAAVFIAQVADYNLSFGQIFAMSITATLTAIGGSSVPSAGLITMILVLTSVGLPLDDISLVLTLDWIIDRSRTSTNVMGDAFCAGIVDHIYRDHLRRSD